MRSCSITILTWFYSMNPSERREIIRLITALVPNSSSVNVEIAGLIARIVTLETSVTSLTTQISGIQTSIGELKANVDEVITNLGAINGDVLALQSSSRLHDDAIRDLTASQRSLASDLSTTNQTLSSTVTDVSSLQTSVSNLTTDVSQAHLQLVDLLKRMTEVEAALISNVTYPLVLRDGTLSFNSDPRFATSAFALTSYSTPAQYASSVTLSAEIISGSTTTGYMVGDIIYRGSCATHCWRSLTNLSTTASGSLTITMDLATGRYPDGFPRFAYTVKDNALNGGTLAMVSYAYSLETVTRVYHCRFLSPTKLSVTFPGNSNNSLLTVSAIWFTLDV